MRTPLFPVLFLATTVFSFGQRIEDAVPGKTSAELPQLLELYKHLHANPELSFQEEESSARMGTELKRAGFEVTMGVGGFGVVGVMKNGDGPTVLVRADMDGLPVKEQTGASYASTAKVKDASGNEVPVMHACGHDVHMTCLIGVARVLTQLKERWRGTLVLIAQPAEERGGGAMAMLKDGLFTRFPKPDFCVALHDGAELPAGQIGYTPGYAMANVNSVDITVRGIGGHGAWPEKTKDPVVLASQIVLALQTIVSREIKPGEPAVVTVGSIQGGTKHNIIPDEVKLQLTVRSYSEETRLQTLEAIKRIARGQAIAAGLPEELMPVVNMGAEFTPATYNHPDLTARLVKVFKARFGETNVVALPPVMGGEDFGQFGRTADNIPICMFKIGAVNPKSFEAATRAGRSLLSLHSPFWLPDAEPTIRTGVIAMTSAVLELMK